MKKLVIAMAVIVTAIGLQAATINWGGAIGNADASATLSAGTTAYLVWSATAYTPATATKFDNVAMTTDNGGKIVSTYALNSDDLDAWSFSSTYEATTAATYNGYYAVLVIDGADTTVASYMDIGSLSSATDSTIGTLSPVSLEVNAGWADPSGSWLNQGGFNTAVAPEPTSGLLLLLGMAGLALKRKRA